MPFSCGARWLPGAASTGTTVLLVLALSGCGKSTLKVRTDAAFDGPGGGLSDSGQGTGGVGATGGEMGSDVALSVVDGGGVTGQGTGGATATGGGGAGGATSTGGKTGTGGGTGGGTAAIVFQPLIKAFCTAAKNCCSRQSYPAADLADCESKFPSRLQIYPLVDKGTVIIDENALAACVAAYKTAATTCTINAVKAACKGVSVGTQTEGQPCGGTSAFGAYECKPSNGSASCYRPQSDPASAGVCTGIPRGKSGDACSRTCFKNETCIVDMVGGSPPFPVTCFEEDGLYCSVTANPTACKPILPIGGACTWDPHSCGVGNYCGWLTNVCQPAGKLGEPCAEAACADELVCGTNETCVEQPFDSDSICKGTPSVP